MNLAHNLVRTAAISPDRPAVRLDDTVLTYAELDERSSRVANLLTMRGVKPGDRVALMLPNIPEFAVQYYGILRAGASGFVLKGVPAEDLHQAVRVVADGGAWLDPAVTGRVLAIYRSATPPPAGRDAGLDALTAREREVLALIGQGKTNAEIAAELFVGEGTVKTHINHVFTKLQLRDRAAAVVFAFDHDLVTPGTGAP